MSFSFLNDADPSSRFGDLKLAGRFATTKDASSWQENAECYLFEKVMIITVEKEPYKRSLKGSVLLKHLKDVKSLAGMSSLFCGSENRRASKASHFVF